MTLEEFKNCYGDKTPKEKLDLLLNQILVLRSDAIHQGEAGNPEDREYYYNEQSHMWERIMWLKAEIEKEL